MKTCIVVLTFEPVDDILLYGVTIYLKTSLAVLWRGTICFSMFYKMKFGNFIKFRCLALLEVET